MSSLDGSYASIPRDYSATYFLQPNELVKQWISFGRRTPMVGLDEIQFHFFVTAVKIFDRKFVRG
jgi:hypothetical protein